MTDLVLSASSIGAYEECHHRWFLEYIERQSAVMGVAAGVGQSVHAAVERYYKARLYEHLSHQQIVESGAPLDTYRSTFVFETAGTADPDEPIDKAKIQGERVLASYLEDVGINTKPLLVEHGFLLLVNGILVSGHLDLADLAGLVRDLKVKRAKPRDPHAYDLALGIYALGYRDAIGEKEAGVQLDIMIRLKRDRPYHVPLTTDGPVTDQAIGLVAATLDRTAEGITRGDFRPTGLETGACRWCPVRHACDYFTALEEQRAS